MSCNPSCNHCVPLNDSALELLRGSQRKHAAEFVGALEPSQDIRPGRQHGSVCSLGCRRAGTGYPMPPQAHEDGAYSVFAGEAESLFSGERGPTQFWGSWGPTGALVHGSGFRRIVVVMPRSGVATDEISQA